MAAAPVRRAGLVAIAIALAALAIALAVDALAWPAEGPASAAASKIQHVVVIYQENHSFDDVLGVLCVRDRRCDGVTSGVLLRGYSLIEKGSSYHTAIAISPDGTTLFVGGTNLDGSSTRTT